jgi:hypothetical protein
MNRKLVRCSGNKLQHKQLQLQRDPFFTSGKSAYRTKNVTTQTLHHVQKLVTQNNEQYIYF